MGANARSKGLPWIVAIVVAALLAVVVVDPFGVRRSPEEEPRSESKATAPGTSSSSDLPPRAGVQSPGAAPPGDLDAGPDLDLMSRAEPEPEGNDGAQYPVDLEALRTQMPDNLYWKLGVPTRDPKVLQRREEEKERWNELYGKVQSNTASEEEIHRYYEYRREVSEDYVEFANQVLQEYGDQLPERDRGLYELSLKLHHSRLEEIPRKTAEALARREAHGKLREEWLRDGGSR